MSDITINYKGSAIATMDASGTKTLLTEGKYCEDDIEVVYVSPGGGGGGNVNLTQDANGSLVIGKDAPSGGGSVGAFSQYQRVTVTPSVTEQLEVTHTLGVIPKLVIISSEQTYVENNFIKNGVFSPGNGGCAMSLASDAGGSPNAYNVNTETMASTNAFAYFSDEKVRIRRANSARYFNTGVSYTVDIYA